MSERETGSQTLNARFLPFVLDQKNSKDRAIARQCMLECLGYMLARRVPEGLADLCEIANEWDLAIPGWGMGTVVSNVIYRLIYFVFGPEFDNNRGISLNCLCGN